jgi:uncharacterized protein with HEPN domain
LRDISLAIERVQAETTAGQAAFNDDPKLQVWVLYHLQVVGEACRGLSESFRVRFSDPVWSKAIGLRNILIHHFFEIDQELVWQVVEGDPPLFRNVVESALKQVSEKAGDQGS